MGKRHRRDLRTDDDTTGGVCVITIHAGNLSGSYVASMAAVKGYDNADEGLITRKGSELIAASSPRLANGRCQTVRQFLALDPKPTWALFIDSDMLVPYDAPYRMIATAEEHGFDLVGGLCFAGGRGAKEMFPTIYALTEKAHEDGKLDVNAYQRYPRGGVVECDATGAAALLVHRQVLEKMGEAYKDHPHPWFADGFHMGSEFGEDIVFCIRARGLGFRLAVDTNICFGHEKSFVMDEEMYRAYIQLKLGMPDLKSTMDEDVTDSVFDISQIDTAAALGGT